MSYTDADRHDTFRRTAFIHLDALYRFARRLAGGDAAFAEDLVQDTFLEAWRSFDSFESGTNCRAWLYRLLLNCWSHEQRRRHRHPVIVDSNAVEREPLTFEPPPATEITAEAVVAAFDKLPQAAAPVSRSPACSGDDTHGTPAGGVSTKAMATGGTLS